MKRHRRILQHLEPEPPAEEIRVGATVYLKHGPGPCGQVIAWTRGGHLVVRWHGLPTTDTTTTAKPADLLLVENAAGDTEDAEDNE